MSKNLYIIAGCNGAGKTTASFTILPEILDCREFVNTDEIARGLSPFQPEKAAIEAGKIMIERIKLLLNKNVNFAIETTLASKTYKNTIINAQKAGYCVTLIFFWLQNVELAKKRVQKRVAEGGHNIDSDIIERRYFSGIKNLFEIYLPIVDTAFIYDNSEGDQKIIAEKSINSRIIVVNQHKYNQLLKYYDTTRK